MKQRPGALIRRIHSRLAERLMILVFLLLGSIAGASAQTPMTMLDPVGGESLTAGSDYLVRWSAHAGAATYTLLLSTNGGNKWAPIAENLTDTEYLWPVPSLRGAAKKTLLQVRALDAQGRKLASARTTGPFKIEVVRVTSPDSPLVLTAGQMLTITWETGATVEPVSESSLFYSTNGGGKWSPIETLPGNPGSHEWSVPDVPRERSRCLVRILLEDAAGSRLAIDESDARFTIKPNVPGASELILSNQLIPLIYSIGSNADSVYLGGQYEIIKLEKQSKSRRTLAGNLIDLTSRFGKGVIEFPFGFAADTEHVYFTNDAESIQRLNLGNDGLEAAETIVAQPGLGFSFKHFAVNETHAFWAASPSSPTSIILGKHLGNDTLPEPLVTVSNLFALAASATNLFLAGNEDPNDMTGEVSIYRFDLIGGGLQLIQSDVEPINYGEVTITVTATQVFWVDGDAIYSASGPSWTAQPLVSGIPDITALTVEGSTLFALEGTLLTTATIHEVPLATGIADPVLTLADIRNILAYDGRLYWLSAFGIYTFDSMGNVQELYINDGTDIVFGGAGGSYLLGVAGTLLAGDRNSSEDRVVSHDILAGTSTLLQPTGSQRWMAVNSASAYYGSYNSGIVSLPPALDFREAETINPTPSTLFDGLIVDDGWVYWISLSGGSIHRMHEDGSMPQTLHPGFAMGLTLHAGRLYFLCMIGCSQPPWSLMSIPLNGGSATFELDLGLNAPYRVRQQGEVLFVADEDSGGNRIHAVNLTLMDTAPLLDAPTLAREIAATPAWFYLNSDGCLIRFKRKSWDSVVLKHPEAVDTCNELDFGVNAMHADGPELYYHYWEAGLKRISD